jgi:glutathione S-transferase
LALRVVFLKVFITSKIFQEMAPNYKLTYFSGRGRAEPIRLVFAHAKVQFEDVRIEFPSWKEFKSKAQTPLPWGALPVLEVDGKFLAQSMAILRYLGKVYNLAGDNEFETAKCDELLESMADFGKACWEMYIESDPAKKKERTEKIYAETLPKYLSKWNEILQKNGGFFVGNRLSIADICIADNLETHVIKLEGNILEKYPALSAHRGTVYNSPGIKEWVEKRPKSDW